MSLDKIFGFIVSHKGIKANPDMILSMLEMAPLKGIKLVQRLNGWITVLNKFFSKATDKCLSFFKTLKKAFKWTDGC